MAKAQIPNQDDFRTGRPCIYKENYPELLMQRMGRDGLSVCRFCAEIEIAKDTFYNWVKKFPLFSDAFHKSKNMCEGFWEEKLIDMFHDKTVNAPLVKLFMTNRFGWTDKQETKVDATISHEDSIKELG